MQTSCCSARAAAQDPPNEAEYNEAEYNYAAYDGEYGTDYEEGLYGDYGEYYKISYISYKVQNNLTLLQ